MSAWKGIAVGVISALACTPWAHGAGSGPEDMARLRHWVAQYIEGQAAGDRIEAPFSFVLDGRPGGGLLADWREERSIRDIDAARREHTRTFTDPATGLVIRCVATEYTDFPAVEWVFYFKNGGTSDSPILEDIQAADIALPSGTPVGGFRVRYALGSHESPDDFAPREAEIGEPLRLAPYGGRSSDGVLPFFNILCPGGDGAVLGIGWTGQWAAAFSKTPGGGLAIRAGLERTHLRLHPGEEIRTPAILLLFWSGGDPIAGHNLLRRLLLKHYTPMAQGKPAAPPVAASPHAKVGFNDSTEANMVTAITNIAEHGFPVDTYWIDAGWNGTDTNWARSVGSWYPNPERYPNGMGPVARAAHEKGMRFLLWFEPERVMPGTWLYENHPDWLLTPANLPPELGYHAKDDFRLLDLGNPEALAWAKAAFTDFIRETGVDIYRQDFNMAPLYYWRNGEPADRQGMREIRHIMGLYDFYDTLARQCPGLVIDTCASGGRRIDFEMVRRSLILFRSDYCWHSEATQAMTYGLSFWTPITGLGSVGKDPYNFRSGMGAHMSLALDYYDDPALWAPTADMIRQYETFRHLFTADYYPLTPYSNGKDQWIAWEYHAPESGEGLVQAFRREECAAESARLKLFGLNAESVYTVTDLDTDTPLEHTGRNLMEQGLDVRIPAVPGAALLRLTRKSPR